MKGLQKNNSRRSVSDWYVDWAVTPEEIAVSILAQKTLLNEHY
jgi:hypothetical protein